jgi:hypothetical protein
MIFLRIFFEWWRRNDDPRAIAGNHHFRQIPSSTVSYENRGTWEEGGGGLESLGGVAPPRRQLARLKGCLWWWYHQWHVEEKHVLDRGLPWLWGDASWALTTDPAGKLHILGEDGGTLSVDGTEVGVLEETNKVSLRSHLESHDGWGLEAQVRLEVLWDLTH